MSEIRNLRLQGFLLVFSKIPRETVWSLYDGWNIISCFFHYQGNVACFELLEDKKKPLKIPCMYRVTKKGDGSFLPKKWQKMDKFEKSKSLKRSPGSLLSDSTIFFLCLRHDTVPIFFLLGEFSKTAWKLYFLVHCISKKLSSPSCCFFYAYYCLSFLSGFIYE